jgi:hypothetical protein
MGECCQSLERILFEPEEELSESDRSRLSDHLSACSECLEERELFLDSWSALGEIDSDEGPTPLVRAKVWERIRKDEEQPAQRPLLTPSAVAAARTQFQKLAVACLALLLGFGLGRGLRGEAAAATQPTDRIGSTAETSQDFLDSDLIELASQDGYSVEIFPESSEFSPIDQEMMSALAPTDEDRTWVQQRGGSVIPVHYISQNGRTP